MPSHAATNPAIQQMYINSHFCYAYKFGVITNGLGIIRHISFYNKDFLDSHPEVIIQKKDKSPDEDKSLADAKALIPTFAPSSTFYTLLITFYISSVANVSSRMYNSNIIIIQGGFAMVSNKIKALLNMKGKKYKELAQLFGISEQAMRNKFARGSFSADELIQIADFVNCQLAFNIDNEQKVILTTADLRNSTAINSEE